ncbi:MAG TPA: hypothetical protein VGN01_00700 [Acidobacteriaceae bacterium]
MNGSESNAAASRRRFLQMAAMPALAMAAGDNLFAQAVGQPAEPHSPAISGKDKFVAIQIGGRSFVDEGVDKCLHTLQDTAAVNVLMATVFTYGTGLAGRQVRGEPLPDHGVREYDRVQGGSFTRVHPEFYADSPIKQIRALELGEFDILADVIPKAKAAGIRTFALFERKLQPQADSQLRAGRRSGLVRKDRRHYVFQQPKGARISRRDGL